MASELYNQGGGLHIHLRICASDSWLQRRQPWRQAQHLSQVINGMWNGLGMHDNCMNNVCCCCWQPFLSEWTAFLAQTSDTTLLAHWGGVVWPWTCQVDGTCIDTCVSSRISFSGGMDCKAIRAANINFKGPGWCFNVYSHQNKRNTTLLVWKCSTAGPGQIKELPMAMWRNSDEGVPTPPSQKLTQAEQWSSTPAARDSSSSRRFMTQGTNNCGALPDAGAHHYLGPVGVYIMQNWQNVHLGPKWALIWALFKVPLVHTLSKENLKNRKPAFQFTIYSAAPAQECGNLLTYLVTFAGCWTRRG